MVDMGIGTGPNLKYYANGSDVQVFGVDPNRKMEKYALEAAVNAGLPPMNFKFIHAVCLFLLLPVQLLLVELLLMGHLLVVLSSCLPFIVVA